MGWSGVLILRHPTPLYGPETKGGVEERAGLEKKIKKGPLDQRWAGEENKKGTT